MSGSIEVAMPETYAGARRTLFMQLRDSPSRLSASVASRVVLRVLPLALDVFQSGRFSLERKKQVTIQAFRGAFIAWANSYYELEKPRSVRTTALASANAAELRGLSAPVRDVLSATAYAIHTCVANGSEECAKWTVQTVDKAAAAAAAAASRSGSEQIWRSVGKDLDWAKERKQNLSRQALWLFDVRGSPKYQVNFPPWARVALDRFDKTELVQAGPWRVWVAWYRAILPNKRGAQPQSIFGEERDREIAMRPPEFWEGDPDSIVEELAQKAGLYGIRPAWARAARERSTKPKISRKPRTTRPRKYQTEAVETHSDEPTANDQLGRRPFAQAMVERMNDVREKGGSDGFAVHLYGPWGAGKTSIILMMREFLESTRDNRWAVVHFNAWQHTNRHPPWWPLIEAIKSDCIKSLRTTVAGQTYLARLRAYWNAITVWDKWVCWKIRADGLPLGFSLGLLAIATYVFFSLVWQDPDSNESKTLSTTLGIITSASAVAAAVFVAAHTMIFGSSENAKFYFDLSTDPLKKITGLFKRMIKATGRPVCIVIDDLDRCSSEFVVSLLEGIQTSFRHRNVAYVVAADRNWIRSSFETRYHTFLAAVGDPGQPLGYLFLEKIFQVSTPVPGMGDAIQQRYWRNLLTGMQTVEAAQDEFDQRVEEKRRSIRLDHREGLTREGAKVILTAQEEPDVRAAVVLELAASPAAEKEAEHLLSQFAGVVSDNPRVMKRMINAFAMRLTSQRKRSRDGPF